MPTPRQIAIAQKKEQNEVKRGIINIVTSAAMHIIYDSHLAESQLWPKKGVLSHSTNNFELNDVIDVQARIIYDKNGNADEKLILNLINTNYARILKQSSQLELIMDQAVYQGVCFEYLDIYHIGLGLRKTWTTIDFTFTITQ